jgi:pyruvate dehydrogenase E2 component (dihydrolipoamide acetyltransferase)
MTDFDQAERVVSTPLTGIRKIAARRMVEAWAAPVFHLSVNVDMSAVLGANLKARGATVSDAIMLASAAALTANPALNAHFSDNVVTTFTEVNIGLAVATAKGLTVPVLKRLQDADLTEIAEIRKDVVTRARVGKLTMRDISDGTFTVSNLGMLGIDTFDAILNPPQVAILAVGSTAQTPVAVDGQVQIRPIASFTLTCDHRAVDGATGAGLLTGIRDTLQNGNW